MYIYMQECYLVNCVPADAPAPDGARQPVPPFTNMV